MSRSQLTSTDQQNSGGPVSPFVAGKNKIINGDFGIWQRGTSFSNPANETYLADRFNIVFDGTGSTRTISQQAQTPNAISGYDYPYFFRFAQTVAGSGGTYVGMNQRIEGVQTFAANTITLSFWAKADATRTITPNLQQNFGSGGSTTVSTGNTAITITTSWARYTQTFNLPSISGKTIGTSSFLQLFLGLAANTVQTVDLFGVQLEAGSVATPFTTATGTLSGELAACQRYYQRWSNQAYGVYGIGYSASANSTIVSISLPVQMRIAPTSLETSAMNTFYWESSAAGNTPTSVTLGGSTTQYVGQFSVNKASSFSAGSATSVFAYNVSGFLAFSAEL